MGVKTCKTCGEEKSTTEYYKAGKYLQSHCKPCYSKKITPFTLNWQRRIKGVYGIFSGETCLYVGESKQLNHRMSRHRQYIKNPDAKTRGSKQLYYNLRQYSNIEFKILEETDNHVKREQTWIEYMCPLYNS